jgi:signal transduction histidine kinase
MTALIADWRTLDPERRDIAFAAALLAIFLTELLTSAAREGPVWLNVLGAVLLCGPLAFRRRSPTLVMLAVGAGAVLLEATATTPRETISAIFAICVPPWTAAVGRDVRQAAETLATCFAAVLAMWAVDGFAGDAVGDVLGVYILAVIGWFAGRALRHRKALTDELAAKTARLEAEQEERSRRAVAAERRRIARELHDVVAHNVSVMTIQAGAARSVVDHDPARAEEALEVVQQAGREALTEMRRMLGIMRPGDAAPELAPQPSLSGVAELVERARESGLPVALSVEGDPVTLSTGIDLAAYRIVQEALNNTIKHAGRASARVVVRYEPDALELEVADDGRGPALSGSAQSAVPAGGHGLVGMKERVALYGGELETGRRRGGGFRVRARLPLAAGPGVPHRTAGGVPQ